MGLKFGAYFILSIIYCLTGAIGKIGLLLREQKLARYVEWVFSNNFFGDYRKVLNLKRQLP